MQSSDDTSVDAIERAIRRLAQQPPERAAFDLGAVTNRAIIELHNVARKEASARRGASDWGAWARLANAARSGVLQIAAVRDSLKSLPTSPQTSASETRERRPVAEASDEESVQ
ncbi:MAG TPA: hypothetical protein VFC51_17985 [Chloroflexota bacterium]|nr:hypothetical protein [Chloroflexota bacterium]